MICQAVAYCCRGDAAHGLACLMHPSVSSLLCCLQHLLASLLAPSTRIPDRSSAHLIVGSQRLDATWQQGTTSWQVEVAESTGRQGGWTLLFVDRPVAGLPVASGGSGRAHRLSVLLRTTALSGAVSFSAPDPTVAPPDPHEGADSGAKGAVVQCVARGPWGSYLPVSVVGWEQAAEEQQGNRPQQHTSGEQPAGGTHSTVVLLTVGSQQRIRWTTYCFAFEMRMQR
jgi:hypothetical protein